MERYLKEIRKRIGFLDRNGKKYISSFKDNILAEFGENVTYNQLIDKYGSPEDIVQVYLESEGVDTLNKQRKIRIYLTIALVTFIAIAVILLVKSHIEGTNSYVDREKTITEKEHK